MFMKKNLIYIIVVFIVVISTFYLFKMFVHSSCKGNEGQGIPWWPNSGCNCKGILIGKSGSTGAIGSGAKYCIGVIK